MAYLKLPLTINRDGVFDLSTSKNDFIMSRLKIFVLSGSGHYLYLPSSGIAALWLKLSVLGKNALFTNKDVFPEDERKKLELVIKDEANKWFSVDNNFFDEILSVKITGDKDNKNGIIFRFEDNEFIFEFTFENYNSGKTRNKIGNWVIRESVNVVF